MSEPLSRSNQTEFAPKITINDIACAEHITIKDNTIYLYKNGQEKSGKNEIVSIPATKENLTDLINAIKTYSYQNLPELTRGERALCNKINDSMINCIASECAALAVLLISTVILGIPYGFGLIGALLCQAYPAVTCLEYGIDRIANNKQLLNDLKKLDYIPMQYQTVFKQANELLKTLSDQNGIPSTISRVPGKLPVTQIEEPEATVFEAKKNILFHFDGYTLLGNSAWSTEYSEEFKHRVLQFGCQRKLPVQLIEMIINQNMGMQILWSPVETIFTQIGIRADANDISISLKKTIEASEQTVGVTLNINGNIVTLNSFSNLEISTETLSSKYPDLLLFINNYLIDLNYLGYDNAQAILDDLKGDNIIHPVNNGQPLQMYQNDGQ